MYDSYTAASVEALNNLRVTTEFQWYLIPFLAFIIYVYIVEVERKNWSVVITGIAFYGIELCWEIINSLVLHFTKCSALWTTPGDTAYLIFVGLSIEISMFFAVYGVIFTKILPEDRNEKILGLPNRLFYILVFGIFCAFVEIILNRWGVLVWEYKWWSWPHVWLVIAAYCLSSMFCAWLHDMKSMRMKIAITCGTYAIVVICIIVFVKVLKWI